MDISEIDSICSNWPLDAWAIGPQTFKKITEVLPMNSTILELGSGNATQLLSKYYSMISIEESKEWLNKYNSKYLYVPSVLLKTQYEEFPVDPTWYDVEILKSELSTIQHYDCILIDGPKGYRGGFWYNKELFNLHNTTLIFDDTHDIHHHKLMELVSNYVGKPYQEFNDGNKKFGIIQK